MKFISFEDPESTILSLSALSGLTCGPLNLIAPNEAHDMFYESTVPKNPSCSRWYVAKNAASYIEYTRY
jgi:hypothetical protein